jgi:hypothetical protein
MLISIVEHWLLLKLKRLKSPSASHHRSKRVRSDAHPRSVTRYLMNHFFRTFEVSSLELARS